MHFSRLKHHMQVSDLPGLLQASQVDAESQVTFTLHGVLLLGFVVNVHKFPIHLQLAGALLHCSQE